VTTAVGVVVTVSDPAVFFRATATASR
jgi:hypothetical protein